jgi:hypothetical protein
MTFPDFLSASYALLAEEHQRINPLKDLLSVAEDISPRAQPEGRAVVRTNVAAQNDEAVSQLQGMMSGVRKKR